MKRVSLTTSETSYAGSFGRYVIVSAFRVLGGIVSGTAFQPTRVTVGLQRRSCETYLAAPVRKVPNRMFIRFERRNETQSSGLLLNFSLLLSWQGWVGYSEGSKPMNYQALKIGARGFEPPTSWSRTKRQYAILLTRLAFLYVFRHSLAGYSSDFVPILFPTIWGEPFRWHKLFGHSFRFLKVFLHLLAG